MQIPPVQHRKAGLPWAKISHQNKPEQRALAYAVHEFISAPDAEQLNSKRYTMQPHQARQRSGLVQAQACIAQW